MKKCILTHYSNGILYKQWSIVSTPSGLAHYIGHCTIDTLRGNVYLRHRGGRITICPHTNVKLANGCEALEYRIDMGRVGLFIPIGYDNVTYKREIATW